MDQQGDDTGVVIKSFSVTCLVTGKFKVAGNCVQQIGEEHMQILWK